MMRRMFSAAMLLVISSMLLTSCKKDENVFRFFVEDKGVKTILGDGYTTAWKDGDVINVNGTDLTVTENTQVWETSRPAIDAVNNGYFAFYAGHATNISASVGATEQAFDFQIPDNYTYDPMNLKSPMAGYGAEGTSVDIGFRNVFSLLELEVPIASSSSSFEVTISDLDNGYLSGSYRTVYGAGTWTTSHVSGGSSSIIITKHTAETKIYVPIPSGSHKLKIQVGTNLGKAEMNQSYTFKAGNYYKISALPQTPANAPLLPYPINDGTNAYFFGKGNMSYDHDRNPKWILETNQWDITIYHITSNSATDPTGYSGLLAWMPNTTGNPAALNNSISNGPLVAGGYARLLGEDATLLNTWHVPTQAQWESILGLGTGQTAKWGYVRIDNGGTIYKGLIILPDPSLATTYGISLGTTYTYNANWSQVPSIRSAQFLELETLGAIFLPVTGYAEIKGNSGQYNDDGYGYYRAATNVNGANSKVLQFRCDMFPTASAEKKYGEGVAVRLMRIISQ